MPAFIEECRYEWKRLGVPESMAEEMAAELEADLAEAQADGISAAEMLGESDPRRFARNWAVERGLVSEPAPQPRRRRVWPWVVLALVLFFVLLLSWLALQTMGTSHASSGPPVLVRPRRIPSARVPNLVGMKACRAKRAAANAGLRTRDVPKLGCNAIVVAQSPAPGAIDPRHTPRATVTLRLRGPRR